jgi:hypothetical protein
MAGQDFHDLTPAQLAEALERAGEYPHPDLIRAIDARRAEMEPLLLAMFAASFGDDWPEDDDPRWHRLSHSGSILIGWRSAAAAPLFGDLYMNESLQDALELFEEDPWTIGPPAVPEFIRVISMSSGKKWHYGRALAGSILRDIALVYPETRETIVAALQAQLPPMEAIPTLTEADIDFMWGPFIGELGDLQDTTSEALVLALFDADLVYEDFSDRETYLDSLRGETELLRPEPFDHLAYFEQAYAYNLAYLRRLEADRQRQAGQLKAALDLQAKLRSVPKIGRNDPCPCGSGKKYKQCHGKPG